MEESDGWRWSWTYFKFRYWVAHCELLWRNSSPFSVLKAPGNQGARTWSSSPRSSSFCEVIFGSLLCWASYFWFGPILCSQCCWHSSYLCTPWKWPPCFSHSSRLVKEEIWFHEKDIFRTRNRTTCGKSNRRSQETWPLGDTLELPSCSKLDAFSGKNCREFGDQSSSSSTGESAAILAQKTGICWQQKWMSSFFQTLAYNVFIW